MANDQSYQLTLFTGNNELELPARIRRETVNGVEYFSLVDIMSEFSDLSSEGDVLWSRTRKRLKRDGFELDQNVIQLAAVAKDGKRRKTAFTTGPVALRIVQSIPSSKAEPIRQWLAAQGYEALEETLDPELAEDRRAAKRAAIYAAQGKPNEWVATREFGIATRKGFTAAIYALVKSPNFGQLTNDVYEGLFHRDTDALRADLRLSKKQNPRDHFTRLALYYTGIAEEVCTFKLKNVADDEQVPSQIAREIIVSIAGTVGLQADAMANELGIDLVTGRTLLTGGTHD